MAVFNARLVFDSVTQNALGQNGQNGQIGQLESLTFVNQCGFIVPKGTTVTFSGERPSLVSWPTNEEAAKSFKLLFGLKKKPKVEEEDEKPVEKIEESESEEESIEEASEEEDDLDEDDD